MGGSESRFVLGHLRPEPSSSSKKITYDTVPKNYLTVPNNTHGTFVAVFPKDIQNDLQKFRIQTTKGGGAYIRFDRHPQPAIRTKANSGYHHDRVELYDASWDERGEWAIAVLAIPNGFQWQETNSSIDLGADTMSRIGRVRVAITNRKTKGFLTVDENDNVVTVPFSITEEGHDADRVQMEVLQNYDMVWELEYTNRRWSAKEVSAAILVPVGYAVAATAAAAGAIFGPAAYAAYGLASVPVIAAIGDVGMTSLQYLTFRVVAGLLKKLVI